MSSYYERMKDNPRYKDIKPIIQTATGGRYYPRHHAQTEAMSDSDIIRAQIKAEIAGALTDQGWWDFIPQQTRDLLRPVNNFVNPFGN